MYLLHKNWKEKKTKTWVNLFLSEYHSFERSFRWLFLINAKKIELLTFACYKRCVLRRPVKLDRLPWWQKPCWVYPSSRCSLVIHSLWYKLPDLIMIPTRTSFQINRQGNHIPGVVPFRFLFFFAGGVLPPSPPPPSLSYRSYMLASDAC